MIREIYLWEVDKYICHIWLLVTFFNNSENENWTTFRILSVLCIQYFLMCQIFYILTLFIKKKHTPWLILLRQMFISLFFNFQFFLCALNTQNKIKSEV